MKNPFKAFSFQVTFFTSFILISALLILLLGITSYYITNQEMVDQTIASRKLLLSEINKQLDQQLQSVEYDSLVLASNPKLIGYLQYGEDSFERIQQKSEMIDLLSRLSYVKEGVHSVQLYAKDTTLNSRIAANGIFEYSILEKSSWYNEIKDADYGWIGTHPVEVDGYPADERMVVSFARKVLSPSGKEVGILVINLKMPFMQKLVTGSAGDVSRFIVDSHNRLVVEHYGGVKKTGSYDSMKNEISDILEKAVIGADTFATARLQDKDLMIWSRQDRTRWITMDIIPWEDIIKGSRRIEKVIVLAAVFCILLAVVMAYFLSRQFALPIRKLIHAMKLMKIGKWDVQIANDYENEFGHLNEHFNQMTQRIDQLMLEVDEQNRRKREAEIQILQEQINPHFIYNTLDMMNWHAIESGARELSHMLSLLGKMLRIGLSSGATFIPVRRELEHLRYYAELQKIRFHQRVQFILSAPESMMVYYTPKLIIQPFVENALLHGLHSKEKGWIKITGWEDDSSLYFGVEDNGVGMDMNEVHGREHSGIRNVHERIQLYFGEGYGVHLHSELERGTKVTISLPKMKSEPSHPREGKPNGQSCHH